jgi:hypothetical protein
MGLKDWASTPAGKRAAEHDKPDTNKWGSKGQSTSDFPSQVTYKGKTYHPSGKLGHRYADGVPTSEYRTFDAKTGRENDERVWVGLDGKIIPE